MFAPLIPAPAVVVPNGVDTERFHPAVGGAGLVPAARRQGGDRLRRAAGAAEAPGGRHPRGGAARARAIPEAAFVIAGEGSRRPEYEALARVAGRRRRGALRRLRARHAIVLRVGRHRGAAVALGGLPQRRAREHGDAARAGGVGQRRQPRGGHRRRQRADLPDRRRRRAGGGAAAPARRPGAARGAGAARVTSAPFAASTRRPARRGWPACCAASSRLDRTRRR